MDETNELLLLISDMHDYIYKVMRKIKEFESDCDVPQKHKGWTDELLYEWGCKNAALSKIEKAAFELRYIAINEASGSEQLQEAHEDNDEYKVCYRFISNMFWKGKDLGFDPFPTQSEAIAIANAADTYFVELLKTEDGMGQFIHLYDFHKDVRS